MDSWTEKTIEQAAVRTKISISILATKEAGKLIANAQSGPWFKKTEHLIVIGKREDVLKFVGTCDFYI